MQQNGVDVNKLSISQSTIHRCKKMSATKGAAPHKTIVKEAVNSYDLPINGLFDGKSIKEITNHEQIKKRD